MSLKSPSRSRAERHLTLESLESRQMMSGTTLAPLQAEQQLTAECIDAVLRAEPVKLLEGIKEFDGSTVEYIADSPVFTDGSFTVDTMIRPNAIKSQTIFSKYDSGSGDMSTSLSVLAGGQLDFFIGGDAASKERMYFFTDTSPLQAGVWQRLTASFDITKQKITILVNGKEIAGTMEGSPSISAIHDGPTPMRLGAEKTGGGEQNKFSGALENTTFYAVSQYGIPEQTATPQPLESPVAAPQSPVNPAATDAVMAEEEAVLPLTEAEANALTMTAEQQATAASVDAVLRAESEELTSEMVQTVLTDLLTQEQEEAVPQTLTDTPDLSGASLQNGALNLDLPALGGTASIVSWQGHAKGKEVKAITGEEGRQAAIAAGVIVEAEAVDTTPSLADVLDLPEGIQRNPNGSTINTITKETQELGRVTICVDDGRKNIYLANRNGVLGGEGAYTFGQADFPIEFLDSPKYVQWIDLQRLSGSTSAKVYIWNAQGASRTLWASESGRVDINDSVRMIVIFPEQHASSWVIQAVNTEPIVLPPAFEETWMSARGELVGVDLSDTEQAVRSVDLTIHSNNPANTIQAIAYCGEERLEAQNIAEDGTVHFASDTGITSVLLVQSDPDATLYVTSMSVSGQEGSVAPASAALTAMSNADVGKFSAKQWENGTFNYAQIEENNGVLRNRGGYENHVNGFVYFSLGENTGDQYKRYDVITTSGNASIAGLWYVDNDGLHRVPQEYWTTVGNSLIAAPGCPHYLVIQLSGNGTFDIGTNVADRATDIMPSQEMELRSTVLVVRKVGPAEGFCTVPTGVSTNNEHARAGGTVNMFYQIINDGLGGGAVTVKIHVGQTGTTDDMVTREFVGNISGISTIGLSVNVTLTADNDIATMEVVGANGESTIVGQQVRPPKLAATRTREEIEPIILAEAHALTVAYWQERLSDACSEEEADNARQKLAALGIGDGGEVGSTTDALTEEEKVLVAMNGSLENLALPVHPLGLVSAQESKAGIETLSVPQNGERQITFTLEGPMMVNLWVDMGEADPANKVGITDGTLDLPDLLLTLAGNRISYTSDKGVRSGESVSTVLPAGAYTLTVQDRSDYRKIGTPSAGTTVSVPLHFEIKPNQTQKIEGRVSIAERSATMPVGMSVAKFLPSGERETDLNNIPPLDPSKPVWVVVHGMNGSERMSEMAELSEALYNYAPVENIQVVTINWEDAAKDGEISTQDAPWAVGVGRWAGQQLIAAGFAPTLINIAGWSHGTYVTYEIASEIQRLKPGEQINALVALDAANNIPLVSGYDHHPIDFASVSRYSVAFDSSIISGSDPLASTADVSFMVRNEETLDPKIRHKLAVTAFTEILNHEREHSGSFSEYLALQSIMNSSTNGSANFERNAYDGIFEGIIDVGITYEQKSDGIYPRATPSTLLIREPGEATDTILRFDSEFA